MKHLLKSLIFAGVLGLPGLVANNSEYSSKAENTQKAIEIIVKNDHLAVYFLVNNLGEEYEYSGSKKAKKVEVNGSFVDYKCIAIEDRDKIWLELEERVQGRPVRTYFDGLNGEFDGKVDAYGIWINMQKNGVELYSLREAPAIGKTSDVENLRQKGYEMALKETKEILIKRVEDKYKNE